MEIGAPRIRHMPPQTRPNSSGMGYERKRVGSDTTAASSSSSFVRHHAFASMHDQPRSASPPASTYFPLLSGDSGARLRPTADAESHFAYSTTLRRHGADGSPISPIDIAHAVNAEASSLWTRAVSVVTGQPLETNLENGRVTPPPVQEQLRDTMSARFAHCSIEVSDETNIWVPVWWNAGRPILGAESSSKQNTVFVFGVDISQFRAFHHRIYLITTYLLETDATLGNSGPFQNFCNLWSSPLRHPQPPLRPRIQRVLRLDSGARPYQIC